MTNTRILICFFYFSISGIFAQNTVGLIQNSEATFPGYTLFAPNQSTSTYLIDNSGYLVHEWISDFTPSLHAYLLENGNLLRASAIESQGANQTGGFQLFTWDGDLLWEYYYGTQHHDIEPLPNGNVLLITNSLKSAAIAIAAGRDPALVAGPNIRSLSVIEVEQAGPSDANIVWEWHAWDHLIQDFDPTKPNYGVVEEHPERIDLNFAKDGNADWLHTNSVAYNADLDQIVVSNRGINELWIIDHSTTIVEASGTSGGNSGRGGDLLYRWGNPAAYGAGDSTDQRLYAQHDAHWIDNGLTGAGHLLVFNNGLDRPEGIYSSVDEIDPPFEPGSGYSLDPGSAYLPPSPFWSYFAPDSFSFYAPRYGGVQRLPNGNTLISSATDGIIMEVDQALELVWEYVNPVSETGILNQGDAPLANEVSRAYRYPSDYAAFDGKDLTPGDPIENYPNSILEDTALPSELRLYSNFPNPFNGNTTLRYSLAMDSQISLVVHDIQGRTIMNLIQGYVPAGSHTIVWNGRNAAGELQSSGIYLITLVTGNQSQVIKASLVQ